LHCPLLRTLATESARSLHRSNTHRRSASRLGVLVLLSSTSIKPSYNYYGDCNDLYQRDASHSTSVCKTVWLQYVRILLTTVTQLFEHYTIITRLLDLTATRCTYSCSEGAHATELHLILQTQPNLSYPSDVVVVCVVCTVLVGALRAVNRGESIISIASVHA